MLPWSREAFIGGLALSLLHSLWQGMALGVAGGILHLRCRRADPEVRYGAYSLLLFTFFAVWLTTLCYLCARAIPLSPLTENIRDGMPFVVSSPSSGLLNNPAQWTLLQSLSPWLVTGWATGIFALSLRHLCGVTLLWILCRIRSEPCLADWETFTKRLAGQMGVRRKVILRSSTLLDSPCTFGLGKSYILLPSGLLQKLPVRQIEALIAHELAHIARNDAFFHLIQICIETALFYHPVTWWLSMQIHEAREQRCDDLAVAAVGDRSLYARALFALEEARITVPHPALGAKGVNSKMKGHLLHRIRRIADVSRSERRHPWAKGALALCTAALGLAVLLPIQAQPLPASPNVAVLPLSRITVDGKTGSNISTNVSTDIRIEIGKDRIELNTATLTPNTPVKVNGKVVRFGSLNPTQQKQLQEALSTLHSLPRTSGKPGGMVISRSIKLKLAAGGDEFEVNTTPLTPSTPISVNGKVVRFDSLTPLQQKLLQEALTHVPPPPQ